MDMESVIKSTARELTRAPDAAHVAEVRSILTGLDVGVQDVEIAPAGGLHIVLDVCWEPLDESWDPEVSVAAMFIALESAGSRHGAAHARFRWE